MEGDVEVKEGGRGKVGGAGKGGGAWRWFPGLITKQHRSTAAVTRGKIDDVGVTRRVETPPSQTSAHHCQRTSRRRVRWERGGGPPLQGTRPLLSVWLCVLGSNSRVDELCKHEEQNCIHLLKHFFLVARLFKAVIAERQQPPRQMSGRRGTPRRPRIKRRPF